MQARRALTIEEFKFLMNKLKESEDPVWKYAIPALYTFQFHLVARIEDT